MDLSIIVVSYNTKNLTTQTIQSVVSTLKNNVDYEIIVSDNNSTDESIEFLKNKFPQVKIIENSSNLGFAKANNIAIKQSTGKYVLLLNSDTLVKDNCIQICLNYIDKHIDVGALGCKVLLENGLLDHACKRGFPNPKASLWYILGLHKVWPKNKEFGAYTLSYINENSISEVDSLTGAFMLLRKEVIDKVGLLDENFFMYGEDIDWCFRIKEAGWKIIYYSDAEIIHLKGGSSKKKRLKTIYEFHRAMILFYNKHYRRSYGFLISLMVYMGVSVKFILTLFINIFKKRG